VDKQENLAVKDVKTILSIINKFQQILACMIISALKVYILSPKFSALLCISVILNPVHYRSKVQHRRD